MTDHDESTDAIGERIARSAQTVHAPLELREHVESAQARRRPRATANRPRRLAAGLAGAAAVAAILLVIVLPGSDPTASDAAAVGLQTPTQPAPRRDPDNVRNVDQEIGGTYFPNYAYNTTWHAVGASTTSVGDRHAATVTYSDGTARIGYTIVDGAPVDVPSSRAASAAKGTPVAVFHRDGALAVAWKRGGHTCVLVSRTATLRQLLAFVDWRAV